MSNFSIKLNDDKISKIKETFKNDIKTSNNEYIDTFIQNEHITISIYTSKKVVFQGDDAFFYASAYIDQKHTRQAGSDEVGTGDYFGPVVVASSIVEIDDYDFIKENNITDSKAMDDTKILEIGQKVIDRFKHSLLILEPYKYNEVHKTNNMNAIKAKMHNQAYLNLLNKGYNLPNECVIDQFCEKYLYFEYLENEKNVYKNLIFETKAESKYPSVAVSSVIARYTFLKYKEEMNKKYELYFPNGAGDQVDQMANEFVKKFGYEKLNNVAKIHFKNTENIDSIL